MASKATQAPAAAQAATPALDINAIVAAAVAQALAAQTPAKAPTVKAQAATVKAKASFSGTALFKQLQGAVGVETGATKTGRVKITAFCADGSIVTVMAPK